MHGKSRRQSLQIMKIGDVICLAEFHDLCLRQSRKVADIVAKSA